MGTYKGGAGHHHSIGENLNDLSDKFDYHNGFFGSPGNNNNTSVRHISSDDPSATAKDFYDTAAHGGIEQPILGKDGSVKGFKCDMADGSVITWRNVSNSDGSPAVDINIQKSTDSGGIKQQKIHFVRS